MRKKTDILAYIEVSCTVEDSLYVYVNVSNVITQGLKSVVRAKHFGKANRSSSLGLRYIVITLLSELLKQREKHESKDAFSINVGLHEMMACKYLSMMTMSSNESRGIIFS